MQRVLERTLWGAIVAILAAACLVEIFIQM